MKSRVAAAIALMALVVSACGATDIADFLDETPTQDLSQSPDPALEAVGESASVVADIGQAEAALEEGILSGFPEDAAEAQEFRPDDPRYPIYEAVLYTGFNKVNLAGEEDAEANAEAEANESAARRRAATLIRAQNPDATLEEATRIQAEMELAAMLDVLQSNTTTGVGRFDVQVLLDEYCGLRGDYRVGYNDAQSDTVMSRHTEVDCVS